MSATDTTTPPTAADEAKKNEPRPYLITAKGRIDLTADPATIVAALEALVPGSETFDIYAVVGKPKALQPRAAVKVLGQDQDLKGDFHVIAENSVTVVPNVSIGTVREVKLG